MVTITHRAEDVTSQISNNQSTIKRVMRVSADSLMEATASKKIPQKGSRHPLNTYYALTERSLEIVGNLNRKLQIRIELTYSSLTGNGGRLSGQNDDDDESSQESIAGVTPISKEPPWKLGARNVQVSYSTERVPLLKAWDEMGFEKQLLNSAGCRFKIETNHYLRQVTFQFSVKAGRTGRPPINNTPVINDYIETVAGFEFMPLHAMLLPMNATYVEDVNDQGEVYRSYWDVTAEILENSNTWRRDLLNIGTFARFKPGENPQQIYQFQKWDSTSIGNNLSKPPVYGSIADVITARSVYKNCFEDSDAGYMAMQNFPYQEVTEPLPLKEDGSIYTEAINDPVKYPYKTISYFEFPPTSWREWNLPKKRM